MYYKIMKKIIVLSTVIGMFTCNFINVYAVSICSGGLVSTTYSKPTYSLVNTYYNYEFLTEHWAKASSYKVGKIVKFSSSFTTTGGVSATIPSTVKKTLSASISYGTSVSTESSIDTVIPANSKKNSKLRFKAQMKKYIIKYFVTNKYYDTSKGYYTRTTKYERYATVPHKNETYIYVYYK